MTATTPGTPSPRPLSLAFSPCPNDTFIFNAWVNGLLDEAPAVDVTFADVDVTNGAAENGEFDVVKVSYAALPWLLDRYALLPTGGALGRGCGPLVLTAGRDDLRGARVAVPGERTTAYLLFRLWAAEIDVGDGLTIEVMPFADIMPAVRDGMVDAGLVIHEARFTYADYGLTSIVDLGEWWEASTALPIPLGAILARRDLDVAAIAAVVRASVENALADPLASASFVAEHAQEMDPSVQARHIALYVNDFSVDLGAEGYATIERLLSRAASAGLVPPLDPTALR